jgi:hypothetical protein
MRQERCLVAAIASSHGKKETPLGREQGFKGRAAFA